MIKAIMLKGEVIYTMTMRTISNMALVAYELLDCDLKMDLGMTDTERL